VSAVSLRGGGDAEIDAAIVAQAFGITPEALREAMREGTITSRVERGEDEDAGRVRLTFFSESRRVRFTCDEAGAIIATDSVDFGDHPLPPGLRKGG